MPQLTLFDEILKGFPIALVSLGATRRMTIRAKAEPRRVIHIDLERISLAFRVKPTLATRTISSS